MKKVATIGVAVLPWLALAGWMAFLWYLSSRATLPAGQGAGRPVRKLGHLVAFAILGLLALTAARRFTGRRWAYLIALLVVLAYGGIDEGHQAFTPGRTPSATDVAIDTAGGVAALALAWTAWMASLRLTRRAPLMALGRVVQALW